jgi:hypothetical protein
MAKVTFPAGETGLIQFDNVADPFGPAQIAEVRNRYQWVLQFGPTANPSGGIVGSTLSGSNGTNGVGFYIKATDLPKATIETQIYNQYNIRRNINTHVIYEPITMTFYDTIDNAFLTYLQSYLNFKFMNWNNAQNVRAPFQLGPGFVPEFGPNSISTGFGDGGYINGVGLGDQSLSSTLNDNFCSYIVITKEMSGPGKAGTAAIPATTITMPSYDALGNVTGYTETVQKPEIPATPDGTPEDKSQKITLYNPKIIEITQDRLDYSDGNSTLTWNITWRYESFAYGPPLTPSYVASPGVIGDTTRAVQEFGRSISTYFTDVARRVF